MIENLTKAESEVLEYFIERPNEEIHIRGLSKELDIPYSTVRKALERLEEDHLLESDEKSKMKFYSSGGEAFRRLKKIRNLEKLQNSGLIDLIDEKLRPEAIVLFGSFLEGRDHSESDIDIAVINGRAKEVNLSEFEESLNRQIQLIKINKVKKESKEFKTSLVNGYVLQGYLDIL